MQSVGVLAWFFKLSVAYSIVWIALALLVVAIGVTLARSGPIERWKYWLLGLLPAMWILVGLWGGYFWLHWERRPLIHNPDWVKWPLLPAVAVFVVIGGALIVYLKGIRIPVTLFFLLNLYFMLMMTFLASMAVTGTWL
jgi:hypothetical protein